LVKEINPTSWHSREALTGRNYKEKTGGGRTYTLVRGSDRTV
jgi:hypothetical protein